MPLTLAPHPSIRTGDVVVLLRNSEHTQGEVIVTLPDGRYRVKWALGTDYRGQITTVTAAEIRKRTQWGCGRVISTARR